MQPISIGNGPDWKSLGEPEPAVYGRETLADLEETCLEEAPALDVRIDFRLTNHEGERVTRVQEAEARTARLILNAGAYTHTCVAPLDALTVLGIPIIEVHLSNIFRREPFRHHPDASLAAIGAPCGLRFDGYGRVPRAPAERLQA